ncbi:hypothetical protein [Cerasicoccus arenae]|nr:hypothetical protein [Cerasicoccus arenae]MBK1858138.1 hypothetical protein [Cerasicoccus arenae]
MQGFVEVLMYSTDLETWFAADATFEDDLVLVDYYLRTALVPYPALTDNGRFFVQLGIAAE